MRKPRAVRFSVHQAGSSSTDNQWTLRVSHPSSEEMPFTGTFITNGTFTHVGRLMNEHNDKVVVVHNDQINFTFHNYEGLDGLQFTSSRGSQLVIKNLKVNGTATPLSTIFLGNPTTHAISDPETFIRPY